MKVQLVGQAAAVSETRAGLPLFMSPVQAGLPNFADDSIEGRIDLHQHLIRHEGSTFLLKATGDSMINAGIHEGDLLIVDRSLAAEHNRVVIAALDGELFCKRVKRRDNGVFLVPDNPSYPEFEITGREDVFIWGVVTRVVHDLI